MTGKYKAKGEQPEGRFSDRSHQRAPSLLDSPKAFETVQKLQGVASEKGVPLSQLALAWTLTQPAVSSTIIGPRTREQLEDNLAAQAITFSPEELRRIDQISPPGESIVPFYQAEFGPHPQRV